MGLESAYILLQQSPKIMGVGVHLFDFFFYCVSKTVNLNAILTKLISQKCLRDHTSLRKQLPKEQAYMNDLTVFQRRKF